MDIILNKAKGDLVLWFVIIILSLFGVLAVYSSTGSIAFTQYDGNTEAKMFKHLAILIFGLFFMYLCHLIDYRYYSRISLILVVVSVPLLIYTLIWGVDLNDAKRWINLPLINQTFQTSDLAKVALIMFIARQLSRAQDEPKELKKSFMPILAWVVVICTLIAPANLSTAAVLFATSLLVMFIGRMPLKYIFMIVGSGVLALGLLVSVAMFTPAKGRFETWKNRIETYIDGDNGGSYQNQQAKIAIATGGITGKGPGNSTQRNFLPHPYSDFIFAIIIEEYGLIGGMTIVLLYLLFLFRCIRIVIKSPRAYGALLAVGLAFSLVIQAFINMGVAVNVFPVTGLPLPLVSMGGTSILFNSIAFGIILSVSRKVEEGHKEEEIEASSAVSPSDNVDNNLQAQTI
ncbi:MAG: FtsW/RodA/SpoVE family cell cycle protein [Bacteroidota bacterium]|nr:FtsW/RodA/SpoVE family cell cycle protein [Bacteroidota bacterium]